MIREVTQRQHKSVITDTNTTVPTEKNSNKKIVTRERTITTSGRPMRKMFEKKKELWERRHKHNTSSQFEHSRVTD